MTTRERTEATFFVDSFFLDPSVPSRAFLVFLVVLRSSPKNSDLPFERKSFLHLLRDPEGSPLPRFVGNVPLSFFRRAETGGKEEFNTTGPREAKKFSRVE